MRGPAAGAPARRRGHRHGGASLARPSRRGGTRLRRSVVGAHALAAGQLGSRWDRRVGLRLMGSRRSARRGRCIHPSRGGCQPRRGRARRPGPEHRAGRCLARRRVRTKAQLSGATVGTRRTLAAAVTRSGALRRVARISSTISTDQRTGRPSRSRNHWDGRHCAPPAGRASSPRTCRDRSLAAHQRPLAYRSSRIATNPAESEADTSDSEHNGSASRAGRSSPDSISALRGSGTAGR